MSNNFLLYVANMRVPTEKAHGYQIFKSCEAFKNQGQRVEVVVPFRFNESALHNLSPTQYYHLREAVRYKRLWAIDLLPLARFTPWKQASFDMIFALLNTFSFSISLIFFVLRNKEITIIYTRDTNIFSLIQPILSRLRPKLRYVIEIHSMPTISWRMKRFLKILRKSDLVVSINKQMKKIIFTEDRLFSVPIIVAHDAVDLNLFSQNFEKNFMRDKLRLPKNKIIISFVGKFHTNGLEKGIDDIIKASELLSKKRSDLVFLFVGGPEDYIKKYKKRIGDLGLNTENYQFRDKRPVIEVPEYLCASDILLMPHPDHIFFKMCISPLKLFEYMASARPIIASTIPSVQEILIHDHNAFLVGPSSPPDIARGILEILADPKRGERLAKQAHIDVQGMTWNHRAKKIMSSTDDFLRA